MDTLEEIADKLENNDKIIEALVDELYHKADKEEVNQALTNIIEALEAIDLTNYETKVNAQQTYLKKTDLTPISDEELDEILV